MKQIIIILIILVAVGLNAVTFDLSMAMRTPKTDSTTVDYELSGRCSIDSLLSVEIEFERQDGEYYNNYELFAWQYYKFLQFSGKYIDIQEDDIKIISVDMRLKYKTHSIGVAEVWNLHPQINLVFGEDIHWKFGIPYLIPIEFRAVTNFYTNDFINYNNETEIQFNGSVSSIVKIYLRFKERYYDDFNFSIKIGIGITL